MKRPTPQDLIVVYNTGGLGPNPYLKAGYQSFFERAEAHDFVMIHNLIYRKPMQFAQMSLLRTHHAGQPISDFKALAKYGRKREKWWAVYLGSPETFALRPGESDWKWCSRAIDELRPIIDARPDAIIFDAFQELNEIRYWMLAAKLRNVYGIELLFEPARYRDALELADWGVAIQTEYIESRESTAKGASGWDTGKNKLRPLVPPSEQPWAIELIRGRDTKAEVTHARAHQRVPAVNYPKLKELAK
jgi:hypothetical protein